MNKSFKVFFRFVVVYLSTVGILWGFLEAFTYFQGNKLKHIIGPYWVLMYIAPLFSSFLIIYVRYRKEIADGHFGRLDIIQKLGKSIFIPIGVIFLFILLIFLIDIDLRFVIFGFFISLILFVLFKLMSKQEKLGLKHITRPVLVLIWASLILVIVTLTFLMTSIFLGYPLDLKHWIENGNGDDIFRYETRPRVYLPPGSFVINQNDTIYTDPDNNKYGVMDSKYRVLIKAEYDYIESDFGVPRVKDGLIKAMYKGKWGFLNNKGVVVIPFEYKEVGTFNSGLAPVLKDNYWIFIDRNNRNVLSRSFEYAEEYRDENALVLIKKQWYKINKQGNCVKDCPPKGNFFESTSLEILSKKLTESNEVDVICRNITDNDIVITKIGIKILKDYGVAAQYGLHPTAKYKIEIDKIGEGNTKYLDVSFVIKRNSADRLLIDLATTGLYDIEITFYYNRSEMNSFKISTL
jgi:hypothetical protein